MNRTDRLSALVEELRAISPRCRSARELSVRLGVSVRTVERDISALRKAGVPVYAEPGRRGAYSIGGGPPVSPLDLTPAEAVAVAVALSGSRGRSSAAVHAHSALRKLAAAMPPPAGRPAGATGDPSVDAASGALEVRAAVARVIEDALLLRRVLRMSYDDRLGNLTERDVEPGVFIGGRGGFWYLVAWCRLREDVRVFRLDRITGARLTGETAGPRRSLEEFAPAIPGLITGDQPPG
ncbi:YafY family protein [Sphaerisporangium sp. TRM90804]|uniref:helix-turn-helix transcriptional regulator n=1 Tax=Sphaerisporangium sp. TRM90804 TaxID=3031113 RepID=UPI00244AEADB|nr:YafY family protein [Sphaerisporangium sp. TRM90804]MDH2428278.1 YafY family protein [Sphaerisporangium sp. TRM90804]